MDHGGVQQERAHLAPHGLGLVAGHAQQHLEIDAIFCATSLGEQPCQRQIEKIVAGHADPHVLDAFRRERVVDDRLVARIGVLLAAPRGDGPAVDRRVNVLHRQIRSLDHADLDGGPAVGYALRRPVLEVDHRGERVGEIGLEHDSGLELSELRTIEDPLEHRDGEIEVLVLLHVEVDELLGARGVGAFEEGEKVGVDALHRFVECPVVVRRHRRGDLDRYVVHVVAFEQTTSARQAPRRLASAEDVLAEQVDVQADAVLLDLRDRRTEFRVARVDDEMAHHLA